MLVKCRNRRERRSRSAAVEELFYCGAAIEEPQLKTAVEELFYKRKVVWFLLRPSIAAAAIAGRSGCRSHAAFVAEAVVLRRNRSVLIRSWYFWAFWTSKTNFKIGRFLHLAMKINNFLFFSFLVPLLWKVKNTDVLNFVGTPNVQVELQHRFLK